MDHESPGARCLSAAAHASNAVVDLIAAAHGGGPGATQNTVDGQTLEWLAEAARLLISANGIPARDGQLYGALVKWLVDHGHG